MLRTVILCCLMLTAAASPYAQDTPEKPSAADHLSTALADHGLAVALEMFADLRGNPEEYEFSEGEFADLGRDLLDRHDYTAAKAVFSLNAKLFPDSWSAYYDLAEADMFTGDKQGAKRNLEKVTDLNPRYFLVGYVLADLDRRFARVAEERERFSDPGKPTDLDGPYLGQAPPGLTPEIFGPGIVSRALALNFCCSFAPDGREFYYNHFMNVMVCRRNEDGWLTPEPAAFTRQQRALEPHVTLDGSKLYFTWFQPTPEEFRLDPRLFNPNAGIYVCEQTATGWSEPRYVGHGGSTTSSLDGTVFVSERRRDPESGGVTFSQIKRAVLEDGIFVAFESLGGGLTDLSEEYPISSHPCISPDGRTILFDSSVRSGLSVAFLDESGVWGKPLKLSEHGLSAEAGIATYSPDGKYIFFQNLGDIYWISAEFVERLRPVQD